jgi:hypothetical protein
MKNEEIDHLFTYHPPTFEQVPLFGELREAAREFAHVVNRCCPDGADKSAAIRKIREAVMTANAAIACG